MDVHFEPSALIALSLILLLLGGWWLAAAIERHYVRREVHRRLDTVAHVHRWDVGPPINGRVLERCACGSEREVLAQ